MWLRGCVFTVNYLTSTMVLLSEIANNSTCEEGKKGWLKYFTKCWLFNNYDKPLKYGFL